MSAKITITADFATPKEVASRLKIPAARTEELRRQMSALGIQSQSASKHGTARVRAAAKKK